MKKQEHLFDKITEGQKPLLDKVIKQKEEEDKLIAPVVAKVKKELIIPTKEEIVKDLLSKLPKQKEVVVDYAKIQGFIQKEVAKIPVPKGEKEIVVEKINTKELVDSVLKQIKFPDPEKIDYVELKKFIKDEIKKNPARIINQVSGSGGGGSSETPSLQDVTDVGSTTTNSITAQSFITTGGTSSQVIRGNGALEGDVNLGAYSLKLNQIFDSYDVTSIDPNQRKLQANNGAEVLNYSNPSVLVITPQLTVGSIYAPSGALTVGQALLQDALFVTAIDTNLRTLNDTSGGVAVSWADGTYALNATGDGLFSGDIEATTITKTGGLSTEFLKADGSVDNSTYVSSGDLSAYVPYANATQITAGLGTVSAPIYSFTGDTDTGMWSPTADTLAWSTGGSERMRINSTGLGIGTTPSYKFHTLSTLSATSGSSYGNYFYNDIIPSGSTTATYAGVYAQSTTSGSQNFTSGSVNAMQFIVSHQGTGTMNSMRGILGTVGTEVVATNSITTVIGASMGINHNGSGTISNAFAENNTINNSGGTMTTGIVFYANTPGGTSTIANFFAFRSQAFARANITNAWGLQLRNTSGATNQVGVGIGSVTGGTKNTHLLIGTETVPTGSWGIYNSATEDNYFAGNVGIGTTTPSAKFHVVSGTTTFRFNSGSGGITPYIQVSGSGIKAIALLTGTNGSTFTFDDTGFFGIFKDTNANITGGTSGGGTELARMTSTGNWGVGTGATISARIHAISTTEQFRSGYNASNYWNAVTGSTGITTFDAVGSGSSFVFSDPVTINGLLTLSAQNIATDTTTGMKIGTATTQKLGFWNATPIVQPTTNAYTSDGEGSAYTGIDNLQVGTPYAQVADLNTLRVAYETLRASYDDLLAKLKTTGIVA